MTRLRYALSGRDTCSGACETRRGCDCTSACENNYVTPVVPSQPDPMVPKARAGLLDRWITTMRAAYLRHLIEIGEQRCVQLEVELRANDADLERLRVELALVEK